MREFSFSSEERQNDIESILKERKQKIATQQIVFTVILLAILVIIGLWIGKNILYTEFDGYINADLNTLRHADDIYVLEVNKNVGDFVAPGDTLLSYVYSHIFYSHESTDSEPTVVVQNRNMRVDYGLARQDLEVLKVRIKELKKQLETEDHNIRFGLSDNLKKMKIEQELAEAEEQYNAQRRKLGVLWNALDQTKQAVKKAHNSESGFLRVQDMRNVELMKELGLVRYSIAVDSGIVTKVYVPELILVLRGEPIISLQSFDLRRNNLSVVTYVMPREMKHINRNTKAEVIVNDDVSFTASVLMLGTRTEEIPGELRSTLSRDHTAVIVVMGVDTGQVIPFWTLVKNIPVRIRINNIESKMQEDEVTDYMMFHTTHGLIRPGDKYYETLQEKQPDTTHKDTLLILNE
jgi:hypothetical protein